MTPAQQRYRDYLQSNHWKSTRRRIISRAVDHCEWCKRFCGQNPHPHVVFCGKNEVCDRCYYDRDKSELCSDVCEWCWNYFDCYGFRNETEIEHLEVHHRTYERVGSERDDDLVALCTSCHDEITERSNILRDLYRHGTVVKELSTPDVAEYMFWPIAFEVMELRATT